MKRLNLVPSISGTARTWAGLAIAFALLSPWKSDAQSQSNGGDQLAPTPPMGWASWNHFFCDYNDQTIRDQADALVSSGMRDLGYKYVLIQEGIAPARDAQGNLIVDPKRFPHGMKALVDYIHLHGLKAGIYTDVGANTCFPDPKYMGSFGHERQDAITFASWGMDFVEEDYCNLPEGHTGRELYELMAKAIRATGRPMLFYICSWGNESPWKWAQGSAQLWRTDRDISWDQDKVEWTHVVANFQSNATHAVFSAPNGWNDPDMLEVGNRGLTAVEELAHFNMWVISAAPLWSGADLTSLDATAKEIYTNREAIAVDQDALGAQAEKAGQEIPGLEVWAKPLGSRTSGVDAVLLLNLLDRPSSIQVRWADLGLEANATVRDLCLHRDLGSFAGSYQAEIPAHGSALLKVSGAFSWTSGATYEAEWPGNIRQGDAELLTCAECSRGYGVALHGSGSGEGASLQFTHVAVAQAGAYQLTVTYVNNGISDKAVRLCVNGGKWRDITLPIHVYGAIRLPVDLTAGSNTITLQFAGHGEVDLDCLRLTR